MFKKIYIVIVPILLEKYLVYTIFCNLFQIYIEYIEHKININNVSP